MREAALVPEAAAAVVTEVEANALATSLAAALAALAGGAVPSKVAPSAIEALHTLPAGLASLSSFALFGAVASKMWPAAIEAIHALAAPLLALVFALALAALGAVPREVVATAIEAFHWASHLVSSELRTSDVNTPSACSWNRILEPKYTSMSSETHPFIAKSTPACSISL